MNHYSIPTITGSIAFPQIKSYPSWMNKFKKPYGSRTSSGRPPERPRFSATARPRTAPARGTRDARPAYGDRNAPFQKFDAVCSNCGKKCQVPFRPDGTKPVYCKDCFGAPREAMAGKKSFSAPRPAFAARSAVSAPEGKSIADLTRQIAAMNTKIDTMLKILEGDGAEK
jgi:CxxC-x17-CxxC domain-containing protein